MSAVRVDRLALLFLCSSAAGSNSISELSGNKAAQLFYDLLRANDYCTRAYGCLRHVIGIEVIPMIMRNKDQVYPGHPVRSGRYCQKFDERMKGKNLAQRRRGRKDEVLYFEKFLEPPSSRLWRAKVDELLKDFACVQSASRQKSLIRWS